MVAIVSGNALGLSLGSLSGLGQRGVLGDAGTGRNGELAYINAATGNLVLQDRDERLVGHGLEVGSVRTYNSLGLLSDDNADNWSLGIYNQQIQLTGTRNTAGSTLVRTDRDGAKATYTYDTTRALYIATAGSGAYDTITYDSVTTQYVWTDGDTGVQERYDSAATGRLLTRKDTSGNTLTYTYNGSGLLTSVADASGETTYYDYTGTNLTQVRTVYVNNSVSTTLTRVRYAYDTSNRLSTVTVDLSPADNSVADAKTYVTTYTYDGTSKRVASVTQSDGTSLTLTYVLVGSDYRVATVKDALNQTTSFSYDTVNRLTTVTDPLGLQTKLDYDTAGQLTKVTAPPVGGVSATTTFVYNANGDLTQTIDGEGRTVDMAYDANGNQTLQRDGAGTVITRTFDARNQLVTESISTTGPWINETGVSITGDTISKVGTTDAWDSGFRSRESYVGGASVTYLATQTNKALMVGLNSDPTTNANYNSIDWALYCTNAGTLEAYENGVKVASLGSYAAGDTLGVTYDGTTVRYLRNGTVLRSVAATITNPLFADSSFFNAGASITNLQFTGNGATDWSSRFVNDAGLTIAGNTITKAGGIDAWDAAFRSKDGLAGGAYVSFVPPQADKAMVIGLNSDPTTSTSYGSIDWGLYCTTSGTLEARENSVLAASLGSYAAGDTLSVTYDGTTLRYLRNGTVLRSVTVTITQPLYADGSFYSVNGRLTGVNFGGSAATDLTTRYVYDAANKNLLRFVLSPEGRVTEYQYNSYGERTASVQYAGAAYAVGGLGATAVPTEAQMVTWVGTQDRTYTQRQDMVYDARGLLQKQTVYATVDASGNGVVDGTQAVTQYVYDQAGLLLKTISGTNGITQYTYDGLGRVLTQSDALNQVTVTTYDDANRKTKVTLVNGLSTTSTYDQANRLVSVLQSNAAAATLGENKYFYDADGRLRMTQDPTNARTWLLYDEDGRKVADIDATGGLIEYVYDKNDQLTQIIAYATAVSTSALVDAGGNPTNPALATVRPAANANDRKTWRAYDAANRLVKTVDEQGAVVETVYDGASRINKVVRYNATIVTTSLGGTPAASAIAPTADAANDRVTRNLYDNDGRVVGTLDGEGYLTENQYDSVGRLTVTVRYATKTNATYWATGTLAQLRPATVAADIRTVILYNDKGQAIALVDGENYLTEKLYDAAGNLTKVVRYATKLSGTIAANAALTSIRPAANAEDQVTTWTYDLLNRVASQTNAEGTVTQYTYDNVGNLITTTRAVGTSEVRAINARFDLQGRLVGELTAEGSAQLTGGQTQAQIDAIWSQYGLTHTYDAAGRRTSTIDQNGFKTLFFYDYDGLLRYTVNALGEAEERQYNALNQLTATRSYGSRINLTGLTGGWVSGTLTNAINAVANTTVDSITTYAYRTTGTLLSTTDALGNATTYTYNAFGDELSRTVPIGSGQTTNVNSYYDRRGLQVATASDTTGVNATTGALYDAFGRLYQSTDANGNVTQRSYDRLGRTVQVKDPTNATRASSYDAFDRVLTQTDALGNVTTTAYSTSARSVTVTTQEGVVTKTIRTRHGQTLSLTDGKNQTTTYTYDRNGNLTLTTTALGTTEAQAFDKASRLIETTDARGVKTAYTYDAANRVLTRKVDTAGLNLTTTYAFDAKGQQTSVTDPNGVVTSTSYDLKGQVLKQTVDPTGLNLQTTYSYDARGKTLTVTDPKGVVTQYTYDKLGRRTKEQVDPTGLNLTTQYAFDKNGNVTSKTDANGKLSRYVYDADDRQTLSVDASGTATETVYDAEGRVTRRTTYAEPVPTGGALQVWRRAGTNSSAARALGTFKAGDVVTATVRFKAPSDTSGMMFLGDAGGANPYDNYVQTPATYGNDGWQTLKLTLTLSHDDDVWVFIYGDRDGAYAADTHSVLYDNIVVSSVQRGEVLRDAFEGASPQTAWGVSGLAQGAQVTLADAGTDAKLKAFVPTLASPGKDAVTANRYDRDDRLRFTVDGTGAVVEYKYDANGNVIERIAYANPINLASWNGTTDPAPTADATRDQRTRTVYDALNRATYVADALGAVTQNVYDNNGNVTKTVQYAATVGSATSPSAVVAGANDRTTVYAYDNANRLRYTLDAAGAVVEFQFDANGNVIKRIAYANTITPGGTPSTVTTNANDRTTRTIYDKAGRARFTIDAEGYATERRYDAAGNLTSTLRYDRKPTVSAAPTEAEMAAAVLSVSTTFNTGLDGFTGTAGVWEAGQLKLISQPLAGGSWAGMDSPRRLPPGSAFKFDLTPTTLQQTLHAGVDSTAGSTYSRMAALFRPDGRVRAQVYGTLGAGREIDIGAYSAGVTYTVEIVTDTAGGSTLYVYAKGTSRESGLSYSATDAAWTQIKTFFATQTYPSVPGTTTAYVDNLEEKLIDYRADQYTYDAAGRVKTHIDALGNTESYSYDSLGNKLTYTNQKGSVWNYAYDAAGRLTQETSPQVALTAVGIDGSGNLAEGATANAAIVTQLTYDGLGNLLTRTEAVGRAEQRTTSYAYDARGRQTKVSYAPVGVYSETTAALTTNGATGLASRAEVTKALTTQTFYDAFGEAVANVDVAGNASFKAYDLAGRVRYEVDALGYVTGYVRNAFGEAESMLRYGAATTLANTVPTSAAGAPTAAQVTAAVTPLSHTLDRTLTTQYDKLGRAYQVTEPLAYTYEDGVGYDTAGKTTRNTYNAFGDLVQVSQLKNRVANTWTNTFNYYDKLGQQTATADALGNLTTRSFDAVGNLASVTERATAMAAGAWSVSSYTPPAAANDDRTTNYTWDRLNRKVTETRLSVETSTDAEATAGTSSRKNLVTTYGYDALGNLTRTTDAANASTYSYYDAMGRVTAVAAPTRSSTDTGASLTPLTEFRRDAYGNVLVKIDRANSAAAGEYLGISTTAAPGYTAGAASTNDRSTVSQYDVLGHAVQVTDANGVSHYSSYTERGELAKTWQKVTDINNAVTTLFEAKQYDKLGHLTHSYTPGPTGTTLVDTAFEYNAFGDLTNKGVNAGRQEYFDYDNAGRLWRTNAGDGIDKVMLYDVQGHSTAEIRSSGAGRGNENLALYASADQVAGLATTRRTNTRYDALGHVTAQYLPERQDVQGGVNVVRQVNYASAVASSSMTTASDESSNISFVWSGTNQVNATWASLNNLGAGDIRVDLTYLTGAFQITGPTYDESGVQTSPGTYTSIVSGSRSWIFTAEEAASGHALTWTDPFNAATGGLSAATRLVVYKKDYQGVWRVVIDKSAFGPSGNTIEIATPANPDTQIRLEMRPVGSSGAWSVYTQAAGTLVNFGKSLRFDASGLALGGYDYRVITTVPGQAERTSDSGTVTLTEPGLQSIGVGFSYGPAGAGVLAWPSQAGISQSFRYRVSGSTGGWSTLGVSNRGNGYDGVTTALALGTYQFELLWTRNGEAAAYAHATGTFTVAAGTPGYYQTVTVTVQVPVQQPIIIGYDESGNPLYMYDESGNIVYQTVYVSQQQQQQVWVPPGPTQYSVSVTTAANSAALSITTATPAALLTQAAANITDPYIRPVVISSYDRWGNLLQVSDPRLSSWVTTYRYNGSNQLIEQNSPDPLGTAQTKLFYDALGHQMATKDALGRSNGQRYDAAGNLTDELHADGGHIVYRYNAFGDKTSALDAVGYASTDAAYKLDHTTTYTYDKLSHLLTTTHGKVAVWTISTGMTLTGGTRQNITETYTYDEVGRKKTKADGIGNQTKYRYDRAGHLIETTLPGTQKNSTSFDAYGHKATETDANGNVVSYTYNYFGQLTGHTDLGGATYSYGYDFARQLTSQSNSRLQNLIYTYDAAGQLVGINDAALNQQTTYAYDLAGHRVTERTVQAGVVYQDNHLAYDSAGRLRDVADERTHISLTYDKVGNRTRIQTHVNVLNVGDPNSSTDKDSDRWYQYDAMNRQTVVDGVDAAGNINTSQGHRLQYDKNGNRTQDQYYGNKVATAGGEVVIIGYDEDGTAIYSSVPVTYTTSQGLVTEDYRYDALDRLSFVNRDGVQVDHRQYDAANRVLYSGPENLPTGYATALNQNVAQGKSIGLEIRKSRFDANGRLLHQTVLKSDASAKYELDYESAGTGYDAAGNAKGYKLINQDGSAYTNTYTTTLVKTEGYHESTVSATSTMLQPGSTTSGYDQNGFLRSITDSTQAGNNRSFVNDAAGRALYVNQGGNVQRQLVVNGEVLGRFGIGLNEIKPKNPDGSPIFAQVADFDFGYQQITGGYPSGLVGSYTVREGDSLRSIARGAYGDEQLWFKIAEVNGLSSDRDLRVGQSLSIPSGVGSARNSDSTFKPYDPSKITGDTSPNLPQPASDGGGGCGGLGTILVIVVAVVVTVYTAGALSAGAGSFLTTMQAGAAALTSGSIGIAGGAIAAAAGSVASQAFGMAIGVQQDFSWKQVAQSAVGGGVAAGIAGSLGQLAPTASGWEVAGRAALVSASTQGVMVVTGMQSQFNWKAVAASAAGSAAGKAASDAVGNALNGSDWNQAAQQFAQRSASGLAAGITVSLARGGRVAMQQVATDAFGNAIGQSFVDEMTSDRNASNANYRNEMDRESDSYQPANNYNYRNGADIDSDDAAADRERRDALYGLASAGAARLGTPRNDPSARWMDDVERGVKSQARALANFDTTSQRVWGQEDAAAQQQARVALRAQNARAEVTSRELDQQQAEQAMYALRMSGGPRGGAGAAYGDAPGWNMRYASAALRGQGGSPAVGSSEWFRTASDAELHAAGYQTARAYTPEMAAADRAIDVRRASLLNFLNGQGNMALGGVFAAGAMIGSGDVVVASQVSDALEPIDSLMAPMGGGSASRLGRVRGSRPIDYGKVYEADVRGLYGDVPFQQRTYTALMNGERVRGVADNVTMLDGMRTAVEAKYVDNWAASLRNPASPEGSRPWAVAEQQKMLDQAVKYGRAFDQTIYHTNSVDLANHYTPLFQQAGVSNFKFVITPPITPKP